MGGERSSFYLFISGWIGAAVLANVVTVTMVSLFSAESLPSLFAVALIEGACLGALQRVLINRLSPGIRGWFFPALAGLVAGRIVQYALENGPWMPEIYRWPHGVQLIAGAGAGLTVGAVMALPQIRVLSGHVRRTGLWVVTRAVSTAVTFLVLGYAQFMIGVPDITFAEFFSLLLLIAATAGGIGAAIEGPILARLLTSKDNAQRVISSGSPIPHIAGAGAARLS